MDKLKEKIVEEEISLSLMNESVTAVYVADYESDELIYLNDTAKKVLHIDGEIETGQKCYEYLMRRDNPCPFCHKSMFQEDKFRENTITFPFNQREYRISSKIITIKGRKLHVHYIVDVTSLLNHEKELRSLTDHILTGIGIYYAYPDGRLEAGYLNDGYYKMLETTREKRLEYSGFSIYDAVFPDDIKKIKEQVLKLTKTHEPVYCEMRVIKDDGTYKWISIRANVYEATEEKAKIYCAYFDIDDLKKIQQEQEERQRHYKEEIRLKTTVSKGVKVLAIANLTKDEVLEAPNARTELSQFLHQGTVDQVIAMVCNEFIYPEESADYLDHFNHEKMLSDYAKGNMRRSFRHQLKGFSGWYESSYDLVLNPYNENIEAIASIRNVTELVRSEQVINTLMKIDYESIITIDAKTGKPSILEESDMIHEVMEEQDKAKDNVVGVEVYLRKYCVDVDMDRVVQETSLPYVLAKLEENPVHTTTYTLKLHGKTMRKRAVYAYLDVAKSTLLCARQDVSAAYEQEQRKNMELGEALKEAKKANRSKTEFFSNMSHDIRTPMNGILGIADLCEGEMNVDVLHENIEKIKESGDYLLSLINDTLDFQRIESGKMNLTPKIVYTKDILEGILEIVRPSMKEKNIYFELVNENADMDWYIRMDPVRLKQIFINLLSNAVKFTPEGGKITFTFGCLKREGMISHDYIKISDTGIGMSPEFLKYKLFHPFSQEHNEVTGMYAGSGLGLSIVKNLVELMGGKIEAESELGKGSTFTIYLDFERVNKKEADQIKGKDHHMQDDMMQSLSGKRILLTEDHPLNAEIAMKLLEKAGCKITWAKNGKACVDYMKNSKGAFDMILMDIRMPILDGIEATKEIRAMDFKAAKEIPILAMTANAYEEDIKNCLEAGMNGHLAKPIHPDQMYQMMARELNRHA